MKRDTELPEGFAICALLLAAPLVAAVIGVIAWVLH